MPEPVIAYREVRQRLGELVVGLGVDAARIPVAACPGWSVQDVVSHLVGIVADLQDSRLEGVGSDEWTRAQVVARRALPIADVVGEWDERALEFEPQVAAWAAEVAAQLVSDAVMHEFDIRAALGDQGARDTGGVEVALGYYSHKLADQIDDAGLGALTLETESGPLILGSGTPTTAVRVDRFEALRVMGGRRSADQVRALPWDGDAEPYVLLVDSVGSRAEPLTE